MTAATPVRLTAPWLTAPATRRLLEVFADVPIRFVGGCVRDALIGLPVADLDLATPLPPDRVLGRLGAAGVRAIPTGLAHGTVTAVIDRQTFEITTLRRDLLTDGRHALVGFTDDWMADAARRDFTFNALSCTPEGVVWDPFGGLADLAAGRVRFVGRAADRVAEDHLRILRYLRFHARFGRGPPDPEALTACQDAAANLGRLSGERVARELFGLLAAPGAVEGWRLLIGIGAGAFLLPYANRTDHLARLIALESTFESTLETVLEVTDEAAGQSAREASVRQTEDAAAAAVFGAPGGRSLLRLAAVLTPSPGGEPVSLAGWSLGGFRLVREAGSSRERDREDKDRDKDRNRDRTGPREAGASPVSVTAERLRLSTVLTDRLRRLLAAPLPLDAGTLESPVALRRLAVELGDAGLLVGRVLLSLAATPVLPHQTVRTPAAARLGPALEVARTYLRSRFPVTGDDLIAAGIPPGAGLGRRLHALRLWWADTNFGADRTACLETLRPPDPGNAAGPGAPCGGDAVTGPRAAKAMPEDGPTPSALPSMVRESP